MFKNLVLTFIIGLLSTSSILANAPLPIKNQDVSPEQLKSQNKEITKLVAQELSKNLPQEIDKYTKLTKVDSKEASIIYTFEINTGAKNDSAVQKEDHLRMKEAVTRGVCRSSKRFMDAQITIIYLYISAKSKSNLFQFNINQDICFKLSGN
jgi:hypothetical protein